MKTNNTVKRLLSLLLAVILTASIGLVGASAAKTGWVTRNGRTYYYTNGQLTKGKTVIDGKTYIFGKKNGALCKGLVQCDGKKYVTSKKTGAVCSGRIQCNGKVYIATIANGIRYGKCGSKGKVYITDEKTGVLKTGLVTWHGKKFVANKKTGELMSGRVLCNGKYYVADTKTGLQYGMVNVGDKTYITTKKTGVIATGLIDGNGVRANGNDVLKSFYEGGKKIYLASKKTGELIKNGKAVKCTTNDPSSIGPAGSTYSKVHWYNTNKYGQVVLQKITLKEMEYAAEEVRKYARSQGWDVDTRLTENNSNWSHCNDAASGPARKESWSGYATVKELVEHWKSDAGDPREDGHTSLNAVFWANDVDNNYLSDPSSLENDGWEWAVCYGSIPKSL